MSTDKGMIKSLIDSGLSQQELARRIGVSQPTIHRALRDDSSFRYKKGKALEALYYERIGSPPATEDAA